MADDELLIRAAIRDELTAPLADIRDELRATGREAEAAGRKANIGARGFDKMAGGVGRLARFAGRSAVYAIGGLTTAIAVAGGAAIKMGISTASAMQSAKIGFTTMLGSAKRANSFLRDLAAFAAKTPFEFPELQTAASSLISAGIEANKVIPIMTTLGDVTSGMGTGSEGIQRATVALQQMNAAGKITGEDLNQLRAAGIPVYDLLAAAMGKSKAQVLELAQAGELGAEGLDAMMKALETGKGLERFNGLMEKQSASLSGVWSTLTDTINMGLASAFQPAIPVLTDLTTAAAGMAERAMPAIQRFVGEATRSGVALAKAFDRNGLDGVANTIQRRFGVDAPAALTEVRSIIDDLGTVVSEVFGPAWSAAGGDLRTFLTPLGLARSLLGVMADHTTATRIAVYGLVAALTVAKVVSLAYVAVSKAQAAWETIKAAKTKASSAATAVNTAVTKLSTSTAATWIGVKAIEFAAWVRSTASAIANTVAMTANRIAYGAAYLVAWIAVKALEFAAWVRSTAAAVASTAAMVATRVATMAVRAATLGWMAAQWLLNAALTANPIGLIIAAIALLVGGVILAYKKSDTFRAIVDGLWASIKIAWEWIKKIVVAVADFYLKWTPMGRLLKLGIDNFGAIKDAIGWVVDKVNDLIGVLGNIKWPEPPGWVKDAGGAIGGLLGDTSSSRARGGGNLANTLASHASTAAATGSRPTITNALVGGGGKGHGSGDHQAGRALDLTGRGLAKYGAAMRAQGGYAAFHGAGRGRHLHVVPPMGDTSRSMAASVRGRSTSRNGGGVTIEAGAVVVHVSNPSSNVDVSEAVRQGIEEYVREREERA